MAYEILVPKQEIEPVSSVEVQSLNRWTTREFASKITFA